MRISSVPGNRETTGEKARGFLASNLVMPGSGSLAAGRRVGLWQLGLCLFGFGLSLACGVRFVYWALAHWAEFHGAVDFDDPFKPLRDLWMQARWPLLGIGLFGVSWLWALSTSRSLLKAAKSPGAAGDQTR
jgi:hypothetical protein